MSRSPGQRSESEAADPVELYAQITTTVGTVPGPFVIGGHPVAVFKIVPAFETVKD